MKTIFALPLLCLLAAAAQAAPMVVVETRGIALRPGTVLDSARPLVLKQGQHVTLISETGSTLRLDGPYDRPPVAQGAAGVDLARTLGVLVTQRQSRSGEVGTTRGTPLAPLPDPWLIDVSHSGSGCIAEGGTPVFWRPDVTRAAGLSVMPADRSWKAQSSWPAGEARLTITTEVPMRPGETYIVGFNGADYAVSLTAVPAVLSTDAMRAAWMANRGCEAQALALQARIR